MPPKKKRLITAEDLYQFNAASGARISPDGQSVIFAVHRVDRKSEKKYANLWLAPASGPEPRQFTVGDQSDTSPQWSPDGTQIAFLSNRGDKEKPPQIYLISFNGGEARQLTSLAGQIGSFSWSPDGRHLLCVVRKSDPEAIEREKDEQKKKLGEVARHYDRLFYKLDGFGYLPKERWHIWTVDVHTGKGRQQTDHAVFDEEQAAWSPDGKQIAFLSNRSPDPDMTPDRIDLYVMSLRGGEPRLVPTPVGAKNEVAYSPDGRWIAYFGRQGESDWYRNMGLWIVPADGSQPARNLTAAYDLHVEASTINDLGTPEMMPPTWSLDGTSVYFQAVYHGSTMLMRISVDGQRLETVVDEGGVVIHFSFDKSQTRLAYLFGKMADPVQLHIRDLSGEDRQLTTLNQELLSSLDLSQVEELWIKGPDGNDLHGWILTPPGYDPTQKYPSILEIHGGPLTQYGNIMMHEFYYLAAHGYVVHFCNPRGGRGYGEAHAGAIWGGWGTADYADLMAWTDHIASLPYIDPDRMGVTGGSYGGYMTVWIIGHTDRFRAAVTQRCVSNLISMWGSSDFNWIFQQILGEQAPFENLEKFWDHSPMKYIGNARTPTKVIHNEFDLRCPIEQGEQVFVALKRLSVDTEMVRFPNEFHGLSRTGRTDRRISRLNHILSWFEKYLKADKG
jgi:dipeptidyl aminopeptidase/acylaminoacyl peptidase